MAADDHLKQYQQSANDFNQAVIDEFRANAGVMSGIYATIPLLILTATGAKSGQPRVTPLGYAMLDGKPFVIASKMGAPAHPAWYHNLLANPEVTIELGGETFPARAISLEGDDWDRAHAVMIAQSPTIADHHTRTSRKIPYVVLERHS